MSVVLLFCELSDFSDRAIDEVAASADAILFPKFPDPVFCGTNAFIHLTVSPENKGALKQAAREAGMWVADDKLMNERQGPLQPGKTAISHYGSFDGFQ